MPEETNGAGPSTQANPIQAQVKSATRTLDIIEYVVATDRALVAQEIATALAIPVSSLSYLLATLVERGYLQRQGRRYTAGPGLARLQARGHGFSLAERVQPLVRTLRVQLNETASFFVRSGWDMEAIATETSDQALRYAVPTGTRLPMHALASGKAMLGGAERRRNSTAISPRASASKFTPQTVTSEARAPQADQQIRKTGLRDDRRRVHRSASAGSAARCRSTAKWSARSSVADPAAALIRTTSSGRSRICSNALRAFWRATQKKGRPLRAALLPFPPRPRRSGVGALAGRAPAVGIGRAGDVRVRHRRDDRLDLGLHVRLDGRLRGAAVGLAPHQRHFLAELDVARIDHGEASASCPRSTSSRPRSKRRSALPST